MERRAMFLLLERSMLCACSAWKFWIFIGREFVNYGYRLFGFSWLFTQFVMTKSTRSLIIRLQLLTGSMAALFEIEKYL
jgi:hypothetical protein